MASNHTPCDLGFTGLLHVSNVMHLNPFGFEDANLLCASLLMNGTNKQMLVTRRKISFEVMAWGIWSTLEIVLLWYWCLYATHSGLDWE